MRKVIFIIAVIILAAGGYYWYAQRSIPSQNTTPPSAAPHGTPISAVETYQSAANGITFKYPERYKPDEFESGGPEPYQTISLTDPALGQNIPQESEGPPTISIDIFPGVESGYGLAAWLRDTRESNFNLSKAEPVPTMVGGAPAYRYTWSGLYEGMSIAAFANGRAYVFSVTYHAPEDQIRADFAAFIQTVQFQ